MTQPIFVLLILTATLAGCIAPAPPTPAPTPTPAATLTPTPTTASSPTPTATATLEPPLPTPAATHALTHDIIDNVFFGGSSPGCELPCWNGLIIGGSTRQDVERVLDKVFNFGGLPYLVAGEPISPPGYIGLIHAWQQEISGRQVGIFAVEVWINRDTDRLEMLRFAVPLPYTETSFARFHPDLNTAYILRQLDNPSYWFVSYQGGGQGTHIQFRSLMVYDNGLSFYYFAEFPAQRVTIAGVASLSAQFCMNDNLPVRVSISRPLVNGFAGLTELEEKKAYGVREGLHPIEEVIGITQEEMVTRAQSETNPCITLTTPEG